MEPANIHELTSAYALDALDPHEVEAYEAHLGRCEQCQVQLAELSAATTALAFGAVSPEPPARLRASILDAAAAERSNVVPLRARPWAFRAVAAAAAVAACAAVGLGIWGTQQNGGSRVVSAVVVVNPDRTATLTVSGLAAAPTGKTYEAWVIPSGGRARPAGLFAGGAATEVVRLRGRIPAGAVVAATLEPAGGASAPTTQPVLSTTA